MMVAASSSSATQVLSSTAVYSSLVGGPQRTYSHILELPSELLLRVFLEVIDNDDDNFKWIGTFCRVCSRWNDVCRHPLLWQHVVQRSFVVYPLIAQLDGPLLAEKEDPCPSQKPLPLSPCPDGIRQCMFMVRQFRERQAYYRYVQRRRSFVLHFFLSCTLLFLALAIVGAICASEGIAVSSLCSKEMCFIFLWLCYTSITGIVISNVVMQAHFEPQPLLLRLRRNKLLITASAVVMLLGIFDVMLPTALVQLNMSRVQPFSWLWCGTSVIATFVLWQCYALFCIMPDAREHLHQQIARLNIKEGIHFIMMNVPNVFPLLFAGAAFCALQYVQYGHRLYILVGGVPVVVSLSVLTLVFLLDFLALRRIKDLSVALCLFMATFFPLSLLMWDFRGLSLLPLAASALGFFFSHGKYALLPSLYELLASEVNGLQRAAVGPATRQCSA